MTFDIPNTATLTRLIAKEGPDGTGRIVGLSIEGTDGVFIYTRSADWCDDSGAGTFHGDSETAACKAFAERVERGNGCTCYPQPARFGLPQSCEGNCTPTAEAEAAELANAELETRPTVFADDGRAMTGRESAIAPNASFSTVYASERPDARPVATITRPSYIGDSGPCKGLFRMHDTAGKLVKTWSRVPTINAVRDSLETMAEARAAMHEAAENMTARDCRDAAESMWADSDSLIERAEAREAGTPGRALLLNLAALRAGRAAELESIAKARETAAKGRNGGNGGNGPGLTLSERARPRVTLPGAVAETPGTEAEAALWPSVAPVYREAREARADATGFRLLGQSGAFPLWAVAAECESAAIDDAAELGLDLFDPFGPGWTDYDSEMDSPLWA